MRAMRLLVATSLAMASMGALAADPGTGITGTKHDWSAPVGAGGTSGGTALLQWLAPTGRDATTGAYVYADPTKFTTYNRGGPEYIDPLTGKQGVARVQIGLCTKCHTPHQAKSTNLLWNHTLPSTTYKWDVPATTAGTNYAEFKGDTYKGPTTKCLSCHDGGLASTDGMWFNRQFTSGAKYVPAPGTLDSGHEVAHSTGSISGTHPVAMPYPLNGATNVYNASTTGSQIVGGEWIGDPSGLGISLYNDDGSGRITAGAVAGKTGIECGSCHDVHNGKKVQDVMLLKGKLTGSTQGAQGYLCVKCHQK
ncbi:MAG TPA: hypothetical protein VFQ16_07720 [Burkholderiaceae bacterium]|nr:hypothetical protein [Burkholderiaceae bacterium]